MCWKLLEMAFEYYLDVRFLFGNAGTYLGAGGMYPCRNGMTSLTDSEKALHCLRFDISERVLEGQTLEGWRWPLKRC